MHPDKSINFKHSKAQVCDEPNMDEQKAFEISFLQESYPVKKATCFCITSWIMLILTINLQLFQILHFETPVGFFFIFAESLVGLFSCIMTTLGNLFIFILSFFISIFNETFGSSSIKRVLLLQSDEHFENNSFGFIVFNVDYLN
jgi:hypothetical protein